MFHIGDKVRIKQEPTIGTLDDPVRGEYEVGDVTEIIAVIYENDKIWYELNVYLYEDEQCLWQDEDLELVESSTVQHKYNIGDQVYTDTHSDFGSSQKIRIVAGIQASYVYENMNGQHPQIRTHAMYNLNCHTGVCRAEEFTEDELRPVGEYTLF